jgi:hypothetical protein
MAYTEKDYKSKKAFKEDLASGKQIRIYSPGPFGCNQNGVEYIEGPHYPKPHRWYAQVIVKDGIVQSIK